MAEVHRLRNIIREAREELERLENEQARLNALNTAHYDLEQEQSYHERVQKNYEQLEAARQHLKTAEGAMAYGATTSTRIRIDVLEMALMERAEPIQRAGAAVEAGINQLLDALAVFNHQRAVIDEMLLEYKNLTRPAIEIEQLEQGLPRNVQNMTAQLIVALKKSGALASIKTVSM